jgi:hypothetical protein
MWIRVPPILFAGTWVVMTPGLVGLAASSSEPLWQVPAVLIACLAFGIAPYLALQAGLRYLRWIIPLTKAGKGRDVYQARLEHTLADLELWESFWSGLLSPIHGLMARFKNRT